MDAGGFEPRTFHPVVESDIHYATRLDKLRYFDMPYCILKSPKAFTTIYVRYARYVQYKQRPLTRRYFSI